VSVSEGPYFKSVTATDVLINSTLNIGSLTMQVNRQAIKHLHISVLPPDGRIRISVPEAMTETAMRMAIISRIPWIKQQQKNFARQPRQSGREMVSGECHYLWGRQYRLDVITYQSQQGRHYITVSQDKISLYVRPNTTIANKLQVLADYYRHSLKTRVQLLLEYWQQKMNVSVSTWGVKKMQTKWGSCNTQTGSIWLNLELAKKPPECLEYIVVHELVHLLERQHNDRFWHYMTAYLPDWQERRALLQRQPLTDSRD
jgi:predicted metal-dependent hydrolase